MNLNFWKKPVDGGEIEQKAETGDNTQEFSKEEIPNPEKFWAQRKAEIAKARATIPEAKDLNELKNLITTIGEIKEGASSSYVNWAIDRAVESVRWATQLGETEPLVALENVTATDKIRQKATELIVELMAKEFPDKSSLLEEASETATNQKTDPVSERLSDLRNQLSKKQLEYSKLYQNKSRAIIQAFQGKLKDEMRVLENQIASLTEKKTGPGPKKR